uniref:Uncharacterized protein n=1 Tax=Chromera velia CCMP2878 TaxID=1169474 RepID=A0A0G4HWM8_9ALVE|eukprot:Cvel_9081.t1-p1 / transcript=Cvel_9081.t1 / gene=Cvel_9081 / organism=Chromera_velia_CCMP2878 / gene_product=hypothetical protein / transcript_product=hypothetical protein / location=Cvel_scaffold515:42590-43366(-) / protein_length=259 / sequence_SO=supercontig / SO=protein_coding / is_pseudo=false
MTETAKKNALENPPFTVSQEEVESAFSDRVISEWERDRMQEWRDKASLTEKQLNCRKNIEAKILLGGKKPVSSHQSHPTAPAVSPPAFSSGCDIDPETARKAHQEGRINGWEFERFSEWKDKSFLSEKQQRIFSEIQQKILQEAPEGQERMKNPDDDRKRKFPHGPSGGNFGNFNGTLGRQDMPSSGGGVSGSGGETEIRSGKHAGKTFASVYASDRGYVDWVLGLSDTRGWMREFQEFARGMAGQGRQGGQDPSFGSF